MAKVTSKLQVTVPKAIADAYNIQPGDEIEWEPAGEVIRVVPNPKPALSDDREMRLRLFDQATERIRRSSRRRVKRGPQNRGWRREDLYDRGRSR